MKKFLIVVVIIIILLAIGWYFYTPATPSTVSPSPSAPANGLTLAQMQNLNYADASGTPLIALGDVNGDGAGDAAAVVTLANASGPNQILEVYADGTTTLSQNGQPILIATSTDFSPAIQFTGANNPAITTITGVTISNQIISVTAMPNQNENASSSASTPLTVQYALNSGALVKVGPGFSVPSAPKGVGSAIASGGAWSTYTATAAGFSFDYPVNATDLYTKPADIKAIKSYLPINPLASAVLTLPASAYPAKTSVKDAAVVVTATPASDLPTCLNSAAQAGQEPGTAVQMTIGANTFYQLPNDFGGCWAGGCAFGTLYASYQNGTCYQFGLQAAVTDPGAIVSSQSQFQTYQTNNQSFESGLLTLFYQLISTIKFQ